MAFKVGDIVQLKSGGPKMTVSGVLDKGNYTCTWFRGATHESGYFNENVLQKVS